MKRELGLKKKINPGLIKSIWLQFGTDLKLLESEINFLRSIILNNSSNVNYQNIKIYGSLLIPSKQFISRFKFRPWKGVYISDNYINSHEKFFSFTKDLIKIYFENNVIPVIETDFYSTEKLKDIYHLLNT